MQLGLGLTLDSFSVWGRAGIPGPPAPILTWTTASSDNTPGFNIDFDDSLTVGDVLTVQYDTNSDFSTAQSATDTLDSGEIAASQIDLALSSLANGTWYVRAKETHNGRDSAWSNVVTVTIAATSGYTTTFLSMGQY